MDGMIIVLDIGPTVSQKNDGKSFFEEAKKCVSKIIQRRLFAESKDEIALILMGTNESSNPLYSTAEPDAYNNISVVRPLAKADFEAVEFVEKHISPTVNEADWLDAVVVAVDLAHRALKSGSSKYQAMSITLLTDFAGPVCVDQLDSIVNSINDLDIEFMIGGVGLEVDKKDGVNGDVKVNGAGGDAGEHSSDNVSFIGKPKTKAQLASEKIAKELLERVEGMHGDFEYLDNALQFFRKREVKSGTWAANLDIGKNLSIPVVGFYKVKEAKVKTWGKALATNLAERPIVERSHHLKDEDQTEIDKEALTSAYMYGSTIVPFSEEDKKGMLYESGEKAFQAVCFVDMDTIPYCHQLGDGTMYFVARKDDKAAATALAALVHAMDETKTAMIARKVYRKNSNPQMGFAFPLPSEGDILAWIPLPYAEDVRAFKFPSLDDSKLAGEISDAEIALIDQLIDVCDLSDKKKLKAEGKFDYDPESTPNPVMHRLYECLTFRGLHPDDPMPDTVSDSLARLVQPEPSEVLEKLAAKLREAFPLVEAEKKNRWVRSGAETFGDKKENEDEPDGKRPKLDDDVDFDPVNVAFGGSARVTEIRSVQPVEDFKAMLSQLGTDPSREKVVKIMKQMQDMIRELLVNSLGSSYYRKAANCLKALREESVSKNPDGFNQWLKQFKDELYVRKRDDFWRDFVANRMELGLITDSESQDSGVSSAEAEQFFRERSVAERPEAADVADEPAGEDDIDELI